MNLDFDEFDTEQASALLRAIGNRQRLRILLLLAERAHGDRAGSPGRAEPVGRVAAPCAVAAGQTGPFRRDGQMTFDALDGTEVQAS